MSVRVTRNTSWNGRAEISKRNDGKQSGKVAASGVSGHSSLSIFKFRKSNAPSRS